MAAKASVVLHVLNIYIPPTSSDPDHVILDQIMLLVDTVPPSEPMYLLGDFNAHVLVHSPRLLAPIHTMGIPSLLPSLEAHLVGGDGGCGHCCRCKTYLCLMVVHTCSYTRATHAQHMRNP